MVASVKPESTDSDDSGSSSAAVCVIVIINIAFFFVVLLVVVVVPSWCEKMPHSFTGGGNSLARVVTADGMITVAAAAAAATADGIVPFFTKSSLIDVWMLISDEITNLWGMKEIKIFPIYFSCRTKHLLSRTVLVRGTRDSLPSLCKSKCKPRSLTSFVPNMLQ